RLRRAGHQPGSRRTVRDLGFHRRHAQWRTVEAAADRRGQLRADRPAHGRRGNRPCRTCSGGRMMRLELVKRPQRSMLFSMLSPFIAFALTIVAGALMFAFLGVNPAPALYTYFISPVTEVWQLHELAIKAAPLILIAVGLSVCFRSNIWNIGAEGQFIFGAIFGSFIPVLYPDLQGPFVLPMMLLMGMVGGAAYAAIPALLKTRFNTNEIL